jgi:hypothetical protein
MATFVDYDADHEETLRTLWTAYLEEGAIPLREVGYEMDVPAVVAADLANIAQFRPRTVTCSSPSTRVSRWAAAPCA